jgi:hypothetical protein
MKLMSPFSKLVIVVASFIFPGCGADTDASSHEVNTQSVVARASVEDGARPTGSNDVLVEVEADDRTDLLPESIMLAQAQSTQTSAPITFTNEGEQPAKPSSTSPTFGEGNLWVSGLANSLDSTTREKAEAGFEWVTPATKKNSGRDNIGGSGFEWANGKSEAQSEGA